MKKLIKILLLILVTGLFLQESAYSYDPYKAQAELQQCKQKDSSVCYKNLLYKYNDNVIRFAYAEALKNEKNYSAAKLEFQNIIRNEKKHPMLVAKAEAQLKHIASIENTKKVLKSIDKGDYLDDINFTTKWQNPRYIKVYVKGRTGKENILKKAFTIWDNCQRNVNFALVNNEKQADIVCYFVDHISDTAAGRTYSTYNPVTGYFINAKIKIARFKPGTQSYYNDDFLLSTMLHEIGHAIGIQGHSKNQYDVMYYSTDSYQHKTLSQRDINTIKQLYK